MENLEQALSEVENGFTEMSESNRNNKAFDIIVYHPDNEQKTTLYVTPMNQLGQVLEATAPQLGIVLEKTPIFINESTAQSTTDPKTTLEDFKVTENTVLSITTDGKVAAR